MPNVIHVLREPRFFFFFFVFFVFLGGMGRGGGFNAIPVSVLSIFIATAYDILRFTAKIEIKM